MPPVKRAAPSLADRLKAEKDTPAPDPVVESDPATEPELVDGPAEPEFDSDESYDEDPKDDPILSQNVVATVPNKTPAELAAETPQETADRYNIDNTVTKEDAANPRVQVYADEVRNEIQSGTHLHPDVAKDNIGNRNLGTSTESGTVTHTVTEYAYADEAEQDDKGRARLDIKEDVDSSENPNVVNEDNE